jgi:hypothetical protein
MGGRVVEGTGLEKRAHLFFWYFVIPPAPSYSLIFRSSP